ncbi:MAG: ecdysteroid 22-kinase family protein [Cyclobacteriaceae bacterium]|nr:ecdysteroid 22-kinase family protein [Cyclobacteriaceae bacterium]
MNQAILDQLLQITSSKSMISNETIQSLWGGYGEIFRCKLTGGKYDQIVVKNVKLPETNDHPHGWNTDISHQRKLKSYQVEMNWYNEPGKQTDDSCRIPKIIHSWQQEGEMLLVMEDLSTSGFPLRKSHVDLSEIKVCLKWLANFHAKYMKIKPKGLWEVGSYWHLDTRPDEWQQMESIALKDAAHAIDTKLNDCAYQTIIHGDAKLANFCFSADALQVAAVDFQYVGGGCGIKDVAYFLSSCLHEEDIVRHEEELLRYYFVLLENALGNYSKDVKIQEVIEEYRTLYKYAWADFYRFLDGWSPGHWKMHGYSKKMTEEVINELRA